MVTTSQLGCCGMHGRASACYSDASACRMLQRSSAWRAAGMQMQGHCRLRDGRKDLHICALDAAMPFDFEHKAKQSLKMQKALKIGIVGFGKFGQFLAKRLIDAGHQVLATSRQPYEAEAKAMGATFFRDANDLCEEHPDVVILASSILSTHAMLKSLPVQRLRRSTLFVDVLSVKEFPKSLMLAELPQEVDILCTHPMFGPDSGKGSWAGLNLMYEKVRIGSTPQRQRRVTALLKFFEDEGCKMVEMSCEEHDRHAASTQFITHTVGRVLGHMNPTSTPIDTRGYQSLLDLVDNTTHDSFELYYGLFMYNSNATEELRRLEAAFNHVRQSLFSKLHDVVRDQLFLTEANPAPTSSVPASDNFASSASGTSANADPAHPSAAKLSPASPSAAGDTRNPAESRITENDHAGADGANGSGRDSDGSGDTAGFGARTAAGSERRLNGALPPESLSNAGKPAQIRGPETGRVRSLEG